MKDYLDKWATLAEFLGVDREDVKPDAYTRNLFSHDGEEYLILTDAESDVATRDYILESLWAFNPSFILENCNLDTSENVVKSLQAFQEKCCDRCNEFIKALINGTCGIDQFVENAIDADGRGHFLSSYDGEENELNGLFIYRVN